jgi:hypothetical protein
MELREMSERQFKVSSEPLENYRPRAADVPPGLVRDNARPVATPTVITYAICLFMATVGAILWCLGASASLDGWTIGLGILSDVMRLGVAVEALRGLVRLPVLLLLGILYSAAELYLRPKRRWPIAMNIAALLLMAIVHASDMGSTFLFVMTTGAHPWALHQWAALEVWPAALYAIGLTYAPELLILSAWRIASGR